MLKIALLDRAINEKFCGVDGGRGICPLFSSPPRGIWQLKSPHPRELAIQGKKSSNARGSARKGIDCCINCKWNNFKFGSYCTFSAQSACFTFWEDLVCMADLSNIWKRLYRYKTTHPDVDRSFTSWFSSQMDIRKFALFVFLLNLGILPLTVKGMPLFFSS